MSINGRSRLLGYIRFIKMTGSLEITNFQARLEKKHVDLGATNKRNNDQLAGCRGQGFKLAALVMRRNGFPVRIETNSFYWSFGFRDDLPNLCCRLTGPKPALLETRRREHQKKISSRDYVRRLTTNIWEDVTGRIGKAKGNEGRTISVDDLGTWLTVSMDLDRPHPDQIVRTSVGDLILDPRYRSRIYPRGLRVDGCGPDGRDYHFGYNFQRGKNNRDRQRLTDKQEEE
jgi:hypothetical protein